MRESELSTMETEEKLIWDEFELPSRNRMRLIREHEQREAESRSKNAAAKLADAAQREEGFTSFNGFIQDFTRQRDSPALFHTHVGHIGPVLSFKLSSDSNYMVSCGDDTLVKLWDLQSRRCVRTFEGHGKSVRDCDIIPTFTRDNPLGGRIVSASADKTIRIW